VAERDNELPRIPASCRLNPTLVCTRVRAKPLAPAVSCRQANRFGSSASRMVISRRAQELLDVVALMVCRSWWLPLRSASQGVAR
jgi:hypothetical protein